MIDNFLTVAEQVTVLFVLMGVGALLRRLRLLDESAMKGIVNLLLLVVTPTLIIDLFQRQFDPTMLGSLGCAFLIVSLAHVALIVFSYAGIRHWADGTERVLRLATVFSNAGFMGVPLELAVLGEVGAFYGIVYIVVFNLFMWSWGLWVMGGKMKPFAMVVNPGTVGLAIGLPMFFFSVRLPVPLHDPIHYLAALNTPVAMIVIGYYLAGANLRAALRMRMCWVSAGVRLLVYPLALTAALYPFRASLDRTMVLAVVIAASAPVAAMVSMFAAKFDRDVDVSVGLVSGTTLLSIITMPLVIAIAMSIF